MCRNDSCELHTFVECQNNLDVLKSTPHARSTRVINSIKQRSLGEILLIIPAHYTVHLVHHTPLRKCFDETRATAWMR